MKRSIKFTRGILTIASILLFFSCQDEIDPRSTTPEVEQTIHFDSTIVGVYNLAEAHYDSAFKFDAYRLEFVSDSVFELIISRNTYPEKLGKCERSYWSDYVRGSIKFIDGQYHMGGYYFENYNYETRKGNCLRTHRYEREVDILHHTTDTLILSLRGVAESGDSVQEEIKLWKLILPEKCDINDQDRDLSILGKWENYQHPEYYYFAFSKYTFEFLEDSTYRMSVHSFTDAIAHDDPCGYSWTYYSKGSIGIKNGKYVFNGAYTDSAYNVEKPNCRGVLVQERPFWIPCIRENSMTLELLYPEHSAKQTLELIRVVD